MGFNAAWAKIIGIVLLLIGVLGFFMNGSVMMFAVNSTHNIIHIISGLILVWAGFASGGQNSKTANIIFGIVYLLVAIAGFVNMTSIIDLLALNAADNWLHLLIGVITTAVGLWA